MQTNRCGRERKENILEWRLHEVDSQDDQSEDTMDEVFVGDGEEELEEEEEEVNEELEEEEEVNEELEEEEVNGEYEVVEVNGEYEVEEIDVEEVSEEFEVEEVSNELKEKLIENQIESDSKVDKGEMPANQNCIENIVCENTSGVVDGSIYDGDAIWDEELDNVNDTNYNLSDRQKQVLEWMITREIQEPHGGIIVTDMGTINDKMKIILSLMFKSQVPSAQNSQSEGETDLDETVAESSVPTNVLNVYVHYGRHRAVVSERLSQRDIVITTVTLARSEYRQKKHSPLYLVKWNRIILDDALCAHNYKHQISKTLCHLPGICHWALAGSKFENHDDVAAYSLIKFINFKPLNTVEKWTNWLEKYPNITVKEKLKHLFYNDKIV